MGQVRDTTPLRLGLPSETAIPGWIPGVASSIRVQTGPGSSTSVQPSVSQLVSQPGAAWGRPAARRGMGRGAALVLAEVRMVSAMPPRGGEIRRFQQLLLRWRP